tara:strand:- start:112 stop:363 length:252 start_codon:yes stop_codon:yes gene_type:complete
MKWLLVLSVTLIHNDGAWPSKTYELRGYTEFGQCSRAKADIDYVFKTKNETVVVMADCFTDESYGEFLNRKQKGIEKGKKIIE